MNTKRRWLVFTCGFVAIVVIGFGCLSAIDFARKLPWGLMGGDCPTSYGITTIQGFARDIDGNAVENVLIEIEKAEGLCPQSVREHMTLASNSDGFVEGRMGTYIGDPVAQVQVFYKDLSSAVVEIPIAAAPFSVAEIEITVTQTLLVEWEVRTKTSEEQLTNEANLSATYAAIYSFMTEQAEAHGG